MNELSGSPQLYPQKLDITNDRALLLRMDEAAYRAASFLDDRILASLAPGAWTPWAQIEDAIQGAADLRPLHFIFHTGHVGSTLLSRLIDETSITLGLREPLPLRTLGELSDIGSPQRDAKLPTLLALWRRGFASTRAVVVKATSITGRIAPLLLNANPASKAVYLNLKAEWYLTTLLAGANTIADLRGFEPERTRRIQAALGDVTPAGSVGEIAAMSWLAESLTQQAAVAGFAGRVLPLDFHDMLADLPRAVVGVLAHFGIEPPPGFASRIANSPVLTRYSKAPEQFAYSPAMRRQILMQAQQEHAGEIRKGLAWLRALAIQHPRVAALL